jgi:hypothetical protein
MVEFDLVASSLRQSLYILRYNKTAEISAVIKNSVAENLIH